MAETFGRNGVLRIRGWDELKRKLEALPQKLRRAAARKALLAGGRVIVAAAKRAAPVDTGAIKRNIIVKTARAKDGYDERVIIGVRHGKVQKQDRLYRSGSKIRRKKQTAYDKRGQDPFYFRFIEKYGRHATGPRGRLKRKLSPTAGGGRFIAPRPFIAPAFKAQAGAALNKIREVLAAELQKQAKKAA